MRDSVIETLNPFKRILIAFLLLVVSIVLKQFTFAISVILTPIYYLVTLKWRSGTYQFSLWLESMAISNDQGGNVQSAVTFQLMFTKKEAHRFGDPDDTVSYVLARNKYKGKLTRAGKVVGWILDKIDEGHLRKAIGVKREQDHDAMFRFTSDKYYE